MIETLVIIVASATVAIPALTEAATAFQPWSHPGRAAHHTVLFGLLSLSVTLVALIIAQSADAAGRSQRRPPDPPTAYNTQANPNYGFGPRVRIQPTDVVSGNRVIGRDPDPFIRGELLRHYNNGWPD